MSTPIRDEAADALTAAQLNTLPYRLRPYAEIVTALQRITAEEIKVVNDGSPQQKSWCFGARAALAWVLQMPRGGRKIQEIMDGVPLLPVVGPLIGTEALDELGRRE